jgi:hypothetical protein
MENKRTLTQNNSIHLYCEQIAEVFNELGLDVHVVLKEGMNTHWTPNAVKELLWRPTQMALFNKKSTTELSKTGEIDQIVDVINRHLSERFGEFGYEFVPFPNWETFLEKQSK